MLKLLGVGDMHLGRPPSRLPAALQAELDLATPVASTVGPGRFGPREAWERIVRQAIAEGVHVVALAGDVVERENDFFEAFRLLKKGVEQLTDAGIAVVAVAGNHDVTVLPRLASQLPDFRLLGAGGHWEAWETSAAGESLAIHGWSFPTRHVTHNPLENHHFNLRPGFNAGLLHTDLDQLDSRYAPVRSSDLLRAGPAAWLLGHIHRPDPLSLDAPRGYLGSITGLHPGEHGPRGPWLFGIRNGRLVSVEQWALAPLHWEHMELDLSGLEQPEDARTRLLQALLPLEESLLTRREPPLAIGLRLRLTGATRFGAVVRDLLGRYREENLATQTQVRVFIDTVESFVRPELDLAELARESNPAGLLARRLLLLQQGNDTPERMALLNTARMRLANVAEESRWHGLEPQQPDDDAITRRLLEVGSRLLEKMLAQRTVPS
jgi:exonuclease SbcD